MSVEISGTSCDQCRSTVQYIFTSTETRRLVRTDSPGRPPRLALTQLLNYVLEHIMQLPFYIVECLFYSSRFSMVRGRSVVRHSGFPRRQPGLLPHHSSDLRGQVQGCQGDRLLELHTVHHHEYVPLLGSCCGRLAPGVLVYIISFCLCEWV